MTGSKNCSWIFNDKLILLLNMLQFCTFKFSSFLKFQLPWGSICMIVLHSRAIFTKCSILFKNLFNYLSFSAYCYAKRCLVKRCHPSSRLAPLSDLFFVTWTWHCDCSAISQEVNCDALCNCTVIFLFLVPY